MYSTAENINSYLILAGITALGCSLGAAPIMALKRNHSNPLPTDGSPEGKPLPR